MNIITSSGGIIDIEHPGQGIGDIVHAAFQDVLLDLSMCCPSYELEYMEKCKEKATGKVLVSDQPEALETKMKPVLERLKKEQLQTTVAYAPYLCRNTKHPELKSRLMRIIEESIKLCGKCGSQYIVIRPWFAGVSIGEEWSVNREYYLHFASIARENHVMILLENQCKDMNGHLVRGICSDEVDATKWIDQLNEEVGEERFGFCMDVGVCNLCGQNMYDFALTVDKRIKAVILRECDGNRESSLLPFTCLTNSQPQTDWLNLLRGLREIGFDGELILNYTDTAAAFSPILRPSLLQTAKAIGDYFKWQIEIENLLKRYDTIVLFGAGNMCRNYMKCYGEKYKPLFTCDNNPSLWGSSFCGLEVKNPESLKDLPADCAVFICNIYYRDIEKQLRDMGIQNPIAFFNDEYMPSFYFNRLEDEGR